MFRVKASGDVRDLPAALSNDDEELHFSSMKVCFIRQHSSVGSDVS